MAIDVTDPLVEEKALEQSDPTGETKVWIRQATHKEETIRDRKRQSYSEVHDLIGNVTIEGTPSDAELCALECWLTFEESAGIVKRDKPLFTTEMKNSWEQFSVAFDELPPSVAKEWRTKVWEVNPDWAPPFFRRLPSPTETESEDESETTSED